MACPFCALGCRDGRPTMGEVTRSWRGLQLTAHPDLGGTKEAASYLNTTREYAIHCINNPIKSSEVTSSCKRHGSECRKETSVFPTHQPAGVSVASCREVPAPHTQTMTGQSISTPSAQTYDPWAPLDSPQARSTGPPRASPTPAPAPPPPQRRLPDGANRPPDGVLRQR